MKTPTPLHKGDAVAIVATARKVCPDDLAASQRLFESWGLQTVIPDGLYEHHGQLAGDDAHRARIFQDALDDPQIKAIICARGGYGTVRIIDRIDWTSFVRQPKWIVGYSDATVLHSHIHRHTGCPSLHATMPINITDDDLIAPSPAVQTLHQILFNLPLPPYQFPAGDLGRCGNVCAPIVGGNLSILYSLCGSPSDIDTRDKILLLEDLDEYLYHIDRMMQNLRRCGKLSELKGLIVGGLTDTHDNPVPFGLSAQQIIWDCVKEYQYPVCFNAPFGHLGTENKALPLGIPVTLSVQPHQSTILIPCC